MKGLFLISFIVLSNFVQAQRYSDMRGKVFKSQEEFYLLKNCFKEDSRVGDYYVCEAYFDTIGYKHIVFILTEHTNKIQDVIVLDRYRTNEHLFIGSVESKNLSAENCFFIAIDCCYDIKKPEDWPTTEKKIVYAYVFNKSTNRFKKLNSNKVHRINEGFYYY